MNARTLDAAIDAAEEFLREAIPLGKASREGAPSRAAWSTWFDKHAEDEPMPAYQPDPINGSVASATVKRRSMDLSRSLANLRRPS